MSLKPKTKLRNDLVRISVLEEEIEYYKTLLQPHDTGHIHTAISWLEHRIRELKGLKEEDEIDYADGYSNEWRKI